MTVGVNMLFEEVSQVSAAGRSVCRRVRDEREIHQRVQPKAKTAGKIHTFQVVFGEFR